MSDMQKTINQMIKEWVWKNHPSYDSKELIIEEVNNEYHIRVNEGDEPLIITKPF